MTFNDSVLLMVDLSLLETELLFLIFLNVEEIIQH